MISIKLMRVSKIWRFTVKKNGVLHISCFIFALLPCEDQKY